MCSDDVRVQVVDRVSKHLFGMPPATRILDDWYDVEGIYTEIKWAEGWSGDWKGDGRCYDV